MLELLIRYLHFLGIMALFATLVSNHLLLTKKISIEQLKKIRVIDIIFGFSAFLVLATGLSLWLFVGKPASFYITNPVFHLKLTLFIGVVLLSLYPTLFLRKQRKCNQDPIRISKSIIMTIRLELLLLILIPLSAVFVARGIGF